MKYNKIFSSPVSLATLCPKATCVWDTVLGRADVEHFYHRSVGSIALGHLCFNKILMHAVHYASEVRFVKKIQ